MMKLIDMVEGFFIRLRHKKPAIIKFMMWVGALIAAVIYIIYHEIKDPFERRKRK